MSLENASKRLSAHYIITSRNVAVHVTEIKADTLYDLFDGSIREGQKIGIWAG